MRYAAKTDAQHAAIRDGWNFHRPGYDRAAAMARVNRQRRTRFQRIELHGRQHGSDSGYNAGCGCDPCVAAHSAVSRAYKARRHAA
jgi:hypothetical protein